MSATMCTMAWPRRTLAAYVALLLSLGCAGAGVDPASFPGAGGGGTTTGAGGAGAGTGKGGSGSPGGPIIPGFGGIPGAGGAGMPGPMIGEGMGCNRLDVKFDKVIPTVALVIDRSSSMLDRYDATGSRWDVLKKAILDPTAGLVKQNDGEVRFGLALYTSTSAGGTCPILGKVSYAVGNHAAINTLYGPAQPPTAQEKGETPTGESIAAVATELAAVKDEAPRYIVLATDGEPDTCPGTCTGGNCPPSERAGYPRDPNCGHDKSLFAVQEAFKKGIKTFVIGIGSDVGAEHLQALANAGAGDKVALGKQADWLQNTCMLPPAQWKGSYVATSQAGGATKYYKPNDAAMLAADLKAIIGSVRSCKFTLKGTVDLMYASRGQVYLDGVMLAFGDANGWRMNSPTELEVVGKACMDVQTKATKLAVAFPCGTVKLID